MISDVEAAHAGHAHAVDTIRSLEHRLEQAFNTLYLARRELIERAGVNAITEFTEPVTCAWDRWLATHEAQEKASAPESDDEREAGVLRLANAGIDRLPETEAK